MPPIKKQTFKSPDGKEFDTRAEWRDYMMATFYTYKDKKNLSEPLVKNPGDIDGQMFDIGDCENSTLVIMDNCEQVQIDQVKNCRIFIGACASSIFIRNCENCVFYTSCRQLRLREVINSTFYIYSMSEVHIEYSNGLKFAPFNGGYPDHLKHLNAANLDPQHNLWYDIFDHNDPAKDKLNWSLLPVSEYEEPWFPAGEPCEVAVPITLAGSVHRTDLAPDGGAGAAGGGGEQAFSMAQMIADAEALKAASASVVTPPMPPVLSTEPALPVVANVAVALSSNDPEVMSVVAGYANFSSAEELVKVASEDFMLIQADGSTMTVGDLMAISAPTQLWNIEKLSVCTAGQTAWCVFWVGKDSSQSVLTKTTAILEKRGGAWKMVHAQASLGVPVEQASASLAASIMKK